MLRIGAALALAYLPTAVLVASPSCREPRPADAIVVVGAAVWPGERTSTALQWRIDRGIVLSQGGAAAVLGRTDGLGR